ncbi:sulfatase-like hydrolase/transferase [Archangium violaceum]|uniref:sulfatase-like hydrolase/transferase n=1 Tax=Archangium violaceum TaxID=83451 RepID=UPI002B2B70EF|nr:sulfatase-like hydrolase/transferase [Archangium gephyra]
MVRGAAVAVWQVVSACYGFILLEWLFLVTQQGFMVSLPYTVWASALACIPLVLVIPALAALLPLLGVEALLARLPEGSRARTLAVASAIPALVLTGLSFLLIDNFTYTLFGFGVVSVPKSLLFLYVLLLAVLFVVLVRKVALARQEVLASGGWRWRLAMAGGLITLSLGVLALRLVGESGTEPQEAPIARAAAGSPNVIFVATDGLEARRMSAYGYERPNTPFLERFKERTLFFENAFPNAGRTTGSTTSMLTSRFPTSTKVIFPPHILSGEASFLHLPGLLRRAGYETHQFTVRYYADGPDLNMLGGFEHANGRHVSVEVPTGPWRVFMQERYVAERIAERLTERLLYVLGIQPMVNHFKLVQLPTRIAGWDTDEDRIQGALSAAEKAQRPFFMHIHLMGTHCCSYPPSANPVFARTTRSRENQLDDAILDADRLLERFITRLEERGLLENTMVVLSSDHNHEWNTLDRVPLMIHFPGGRHHGVVKENAQLLDVAPTVLETVGLPIPGWMEGRSLLSTRRPPTEPILGTGEVNARLANADWEYISQLRNAGPPLYGMTTVSAIVCDRWWTLQLKTGELQTGRVSGHTAPCAEESLPKAEDLRQRFLSHLRERGFELAHPR